MTTTHPTTALAMAGADPTGQAPVTAYLPLAEADEGFDAFYRAEYGSIVAVAVALTGDRGRAEELTQDAFLAACRRWPVVGAYDKPGAWVRRTVINRAIDRRRRLLRETAALLRLRPSGSHTDESGADPDHELWAAVRALPRRQAQVVALAYVDDLATTEVAAVLGIDPATVRRHLAAARTTLASHLDTRNDQP